MARNCDQKVIGIARIDGDLGDLLPVVQSAMGPARAAVSRFVEAVPDRKIGAMQSFAAPDVNHIWI